MVRKFRKASFEFRVSSFEKVSFKFQQHLAMKLEGGRKNSKLET